MINVKLSTIFIKSKLKQRLGVDLKDWQELLINDLRWVFCCLLAIIAGQQSFVQPDNKENSGNGYQCAEQEKT